MPWWKGLWEGWKRIAHRIGVFNTKLLLFLFYYGALGPVSGLVHLFQRDMLAKRIADGSLYSAAHSSAPTPETARRQF